MRFASPAFLFRAPPLSSAGWAGERCCLKMRAKEAKQSRAMLPACVITNDTNHRLLREAEQRYPPCSITLEDAKRL